MTGDQLVKRMELVIASLAPGVEKRRDYAALMTLAEICGDAAAELDRLHETRRKLIEAWAPLDAFDYGAAPKGGETA